MGDFKQIRDEFHTVQARNITQISILKRETCKAEVSYVRALKVHVYTFLLDQHSDMEVVEFLCDTFDYKIKPNGYADGYSENLDIYRVFMSSNYKHLIYMDSAYDTLTGKHEYSRWSANTAKR